ncbi:hypothetical protein C5167_029492 [Papaver somniferum]|nr:hypothetical protein C5167_029492 [Papaver somniferum]
MNLSIVGVSGGKLHKFQYERGRALDAAAGGGGIFSSSKLHAGSSSSSSSCKFLLLLIIVKGVQPLVIKDAANPLITTCFLFSLGIDANVNRTLKSNLKEVVGHSDLER